VKPILTIAIPTLNNMQQLDWCIRSLFMYTEFPYRVVLVNNHPPASAQLDGYVSGSSVGELLTVRHMERNVGWIGGINAALEECDTELFCMLNDDVMFLPGHNTFWRLLWEGLEDPAVGAVGPCSNFVAGCQSLMNLTVPGVVNVRLLIGFCLMTRTAVLKDLGGLDGHLPGGDDLDLSIRLVKAGYQLLLRRDCYLHHFGQQTGKRLFGEQWDSQDQQEATNNALIRKHGVDAWYRVIDPVWSYTQGTVKNHDTENEGAWMSGQLSKLSGSGFNLGCGSTKYDSPGLRLVGVDKSAKGERGTGGTKFDAAAPDVVGDAAELGFVANGSQDVLVAQHLLEHLVDPIAALDRWYAVLRPGGTLLLTVPDQERMNTILLDCTHVHAYTANSLPRLISRCGFRVMECRTIGWGSTVCRAVKEAGDEED